METHSFPFVVSRNADRCRHYMGGFWIFLATGRETNDQFALIEIQVRKGLEPPPHIHTKEDEIYYLLEGEVQFVADKEEHFLKPGDFIYLPKNIPHHWKLQSDTARILVQVMPAGLEEMFWELSKETDQRGLPSPPAGPPPPEFLQRVGELQKKYGITGIDNTRIKAS